MQSENVVSFVQKVQQGGLNYKAFSFFLQSLFWFVIIFIYNVSDNVNKN